MTQMYQILTRSRQQAFSSLFVITLFRFVADSKLDCLNGVLVDTFVIKLVKKILVDHVRIIQVFRVLNAKPFKNGGVLIAESRLQGVKPNVEG